jgi:hypothetical protein
MRDNLLDLVSHTLDLGCIDLIKIQGTDTETTVSALAEDNSVVVQGRFHNPVADFIGTFGMPNLAKIKILLNLPEYRENAVLSLTRTATGEPDGVQFENATKDFRNNYRFMSSQAVNEKLKNNKMRSVNWLIEFEPTVASIQRLKMQAQANAEETVFKVKTENGDLKFLFGDHSTHAGNFVFQPDVSGTLKRPWSWPVQQFISILNLSGDKVIRISDEGAAQITVDSGLAVYNYILPAHSK